MGYWGVRGLLGAQCGKLVLEKAEEPQIKLPTSAGSSKKQKSSRKTSISALLTMPKPLTVWITINCGKFFKRVKGFGIVNKAEVDVFLELSCFFDDPVDVGNLICGSSAFSNASASRISG